MTRVLVLLFVLTVVAVALWDIARRNPQLFGGSRKAPPLPGTPRRPRGPVAPPAPPRGQVIELRRDPYQVLGVDRDTTPAALEAHMEKLRRENDPERLEGMSDELRAHAERRLSEAESAYARITESSS